jgi:hypothetical protein
MSSAACQHLLFHRPLLAIQACISPPMHLMQLLPLPSPPWIASHNHGNCQQLCLLSFSQKLPIVYWLRLTQPIIVIKSDSCLQLMKMVMWGNYGQLADQ